MRGRERLGTFMVNLSVKGEQMHAKHSDLHPRDCLPADLSLSFFHLHTHSSCQGAAVRGWLKERMSVRGRMVSLAWRFPAPEIHMPNTETHFHTNRNRAGQDDVTEEQKPAWVSFSFTAIWWIFTNFYLIWFILNFIFQPNIQTVFTFYVALNVYFAASAQAIYILCLTE